MAPYLPFIDDPVHIDTLDRQRFIVLRAPVSVSAVYGRIQRTFRDRLRGLPVSYPARAHVTLCGFDAGTSLNAVQELARSWAVTVPPLRIEVERVSSFPAPFQIVIVEVRRVPALFSALANLRARAVDGRLAVSTVVPVEKWTFHMSVAYCSRLSEAAWQELAHFAEAVPVPAVHDNVSVAEVVAFDEGREHSGGVFALGAKTTARP
jgi:2'-5' RNA ligase